MATATAVLGAARPAAADHVGPHRPRVMFGTGQFGPDYMKSLSVVASEVEGFPSHAVYKETPTADPVHIPLDCVFIVWRSGGPTTIHHALLGSGVGGDGIRYYVTATNTISPGIDPGQPFSVVGRAKVVTAPSTDTGVQCGASARFSSFAIGEYVFVP